MDLFHGCHLGLGRYDPVSLSGNGFDQLSSGLSEKFSVDAIDVRAYAGGIG